MTQQKCECGNATFEVSFRTSCDDCEYNGVWDENKGEYIYPENASDEDRTQASDENNCELDSCHDAGCHLYRCYECKRVFENYPFCGE